MQTYVALNGADRKGWLYNLERLLKKKVPYLLNGLLEIYK